MFIFLCLLHIPIRRVRIGMRVIFAFLYSFRSPSNVYLSHHLLHHPQGDFNLQHVLLLNPFLLAMVTQGRRQAAPALLPHRDGIASIRRKFSRKRFSDGGRPGTLSKCFFRHGQRMIHTREPQLGTEGSNGFAMHSGTQSFLTLQGSMQAPLVQI